MSTPKCQCCQQLETSVVTPARTGSTKHRGMKKYQAVIRLNNSVNTSSYSDMPPLTLTTLDESRPELDLTYDKSVTTYYTLDSRRLASKQKNQDERKLLYGIKHFNLNVQKGLKILQEAGFVDETPESVANFLFRQERLSKKQIGMYSEEQTTSEFALFNFYFLQANTWEVMKISTSKSLNTLSSATSSHIYF